MLWENQVEQGGGEKYINVSNPHLKLTQGHYVNYISLKIKRKSLRSNHE